MSTREGVHVRVVARMGKHTCSIDKRRLELCRNSNITLPCQAYCLSENCTFIPVANSLIFFPFALVYSEAIMNMAKIVHFRHCLSEIRKTWCLCTKVV